MRRLGPSLVPALTLVLVLGTATLARADDDAGAAPVDAGRIWASCIEHVPPGVARPKLDEKFPSRGLSGYAVALEIAVEHPKGEVVLPQGFQVQTGSDAARALAETGFALPDPDGGAGPTKTTTTTPSGTQAVTRVTVSFVPLPALPGRNQMTLPPVPIAVARASGEIVTVCTDPHEITIEDPTSSTPDAKPRPNPDPRPQREEWTLAKQMTIGGLVGGLVAAIAAWLVGRWLRRPKPVPPPPPPRPPWEVAFEELHAVRFAGLVGQARFAEHFDRVSDAVRKYLGARYGFDGLETTTDEMVALLRRVQPPVADLPAILVFLGDCDLVKFARLTPTETDCAESLDKGEHIVRVTLPPGVVPGAKPAKGAAA